MKNIQRNLILSKLIRSILLPIIYVNIIGGLLYFGSSLIIAYDEIYQESSFADFIEFQTILTVLIIVFELIVILWFALRFLRKEQNIATDIQKFILQGENKEVEFKSSLRFDYKKNEVNHDLEYVVAKTISGFLNTNGGALLIGIDDDKNVLGIENDYNTLHKKSTDGFLLHLTQIINAYLGKEVHKFLDISIEAVAGKEICFVQISPAKKPVYLNHKEHQEFFIRASASTQPMEIGEAHSYIKTHWEKT